MAEQTRVDVTAEQQQGENRDDDLSELEDPEFFRHWSELRRRVALSGKSASCELKRAYDTASAEYRRRTDGERREQ